jgi:cyclophilin family peptidyl-prolyl cis-trans isomerase
MGKRIGVAVAICFCLTQLAAAQVVRFETTEGNFDMVLNPTNNPLLQGYVNNFLQYVNSDRYLGSWINRADKSNGQDFVLQMGGFFSATKRPPLTIDSTRPVAPFAPVAGVPAANIGLSNTVGTVALALPGDGQGGTDQNAGTSSFFVNLANNDFLDPNFTVFAKISDMTTINKIMDLNTVDRTTDAMFGAGQGNLGFASVPLQDNGFQVFIKRAFVVSDAMTVAQAIAGAKQSLSPAGSALPAQSSIEETPLLADSVGGGSNASGSSAISASPLVVSNPVPEPASAIAMLLGLLSLGFSPRRRRA